MLQRHMGNSMGDWWKHWIGDILPRFRKIWPPLSNLMKGLAGLAN